MEDAVCGWCGYMNWIIKSMRMDNGRLIKCVRADADDNQSYPRTTHEHCAVHSAYRIHFTFI